MLRPLTGNGAWTELPFVNSERNHVTVRDLLPVKAPAFARVLNPARSPDGRAAFWRDIVASGVDATTQWSAIRPFAADHCEPVTGGLDPAVANRLAHVAMECGFARTNYRFLVWEGYGGLRTDLANATTVDLPPDTRRMRILTGNLLDATESVVEAPGHRLALWWLSGDGQWCVGNDIYGRSAFVGGTHTLVSALVEDAELEAYPVDPAQIVTPEDR